jgi:hypothetical protein
MRALVVIFEFGSKGVGEGVGDNEGFTHLGAFLDGLLLELLLETVVCRNLELALVLANEI